MERRGGRRQNDGAIALSLLKETPCMHAYARSQVDTDLRLPTGMNMLSTDEDLSVHVNRITLGDRRM